MSTDAAAPIRVLLVDDSRTSRALLRQLCDDDPRLTVVGEALDGPQAIEMVASLRPSIVVMDIEMPKLDGIEATRQIMAKTPTPVLAITAHHDPRDVALSLQALRAGALSLLPKPTGPSSPTFRQDAQQFLRLVKALAGVRVLRRHLGRAPATPAPEMPRGGRPVQAIGIAASTGGPAALYRLLELMPAKLPVPVLVVQHIADGFAPGLVTWLSGATPLPVTLARHDTWLAPGRVYVAPDRFHLTVGRSGRIALSEEPPVTGFRPSATVLFTSLAEVFGAAAVAVVLTGMGSDGLEGARRMRRAGGRVLAQDADSSVVFGMPKAVADAGLASAVGSVEQLAGALARMLPTPT